jgi:hypothetical protein
VFPRERSEPCFCRHILLDCVYTTEDVLAEVLTFFAADSRLRIRAVETVREILSEPAVHIIPQSHESFLSGLDLYAARPGKGYSLADAFDADDA